MKTLFIADWHYDHLNVIGFDHRPYNTVDEMNEDLIKKWNNKVDPGDLVYCLGDMFWCNSQIACEVLKKLNGNIILIKGNHDRWCKDGKCKKLLGGIKDYEKINVTLNDGTNKTVILSHYFIPFYDFHYRGSILLHGHSHITEEHIEEIKYAKYMNENGFKNEIYNVGCMMSYINYEPCTLDEIIERNK